MAYYGYNVLFHQDFLNHPIQPVIGYEPLDNVTFRNVGKQGRDLFIRDDPEMDIAALVNNTQHKLPLEAVLKGLHTIL